MVSREKRDQVAEYMHKLWEALKLSELTDEERMEDVW